MQKANKKMAYFGLIYGIVGIFTIINFLALKSSFLGLFCLVLWLIKNAIGIFGDDKAETANILGGILKFFILLTLTLVIFFYIFDLSFFSIWLIFVWFSVLALVRGLNKKIPLEARFLKFIFWQKNWLVIFYLICNLMVFLWLGKFASTEALRSPWEVIANLFWLACLVLVMFLSFIIWSPKTEKTGKIIALIGFYLFSLGIALVIYKIGYGFDPFVHRAAEMKLGELGYILPKPFYYIGQYSIVVWMAKVFGLSIAWVDKLLVPIVAGILLPIILTSWSGKNKNNLIAPVFALGIFVPLFFYTVPQSWANLWLVVLVLGIFYKKLSTGWQVLLSALIMSVHPLAGIPAFVLVIVNGWRIKNKTLRGVTHTLLAFAIPVFFLLLNWLTKNMGVNISMESWQNIWQGVSGVTHYLTFHSLYHLVYFYGFNRVVLFFVVSLLGFWIVRRSENVYGRGVLVLLINLFGLAWLQFGAVIDYEQTEFVKRLGQIIILATIPYFIIGVEKIWIYLRVLKYDKLISTSVFVFVVICNLYLGYPRVDAMEKNRGYSVSEYDIQMVEMINESAGDYEYVVLANQSVAAASLRQYGFYKYYKTSEGVLFYYPIPTSSPLYDIYLKMVYDEPKLEYIEEAKEMTGVSKVYFVINDYWLDSKKIRAKAEQIARENWSVGDKVWVFEF